MPSARCRICGERPRCATRLWAHTRSYCKTHQTTYRKLRVSAIRNRAVNTLNRIALHTVLLRELFAAAMTLEYNGHPWYGPRDAVDAIDWRYWMDRVVSRRGASYSIMFNDDANDNLIHSVLLLGYESEDYIMPRAG